MLPTKKISLISAVSVALGILFNVLFYDKLVGVSFLIYASALLVCLFVFLFFFRVPYHISTLWSVPAIIFFSAMVAVRDNEFLVLMNCVITIVLLLLLAQHITGRKVKNNLFLDYVNTAVVLPLMMLGKAFSALGRMISVGKGSGEGKRSSHITKGILITLPIVAFLLLLLSSADVVFKNLITDVFSFHVSISERAAAQIWWTVFFAIVWLGAYIYILENATKEEARLTPVIRGYTFGNIEASILFATLNVLFFTFVCIQIKYLFAGHGAITKLGYTYAEYAHKGFGELVFVAIFMFVLIFFAERYIERNGQKSSRLFTYLVSVVVLLVLVIMASAFTRLSTYEQAYGFTIQRILVQAFIVWLAAVFLWLGYKIMKDVDDRRFVFGLFLLVIAFFALFNLFNPDAFVARKNIDQFATNGKLDVAHLSTLSADAVPELMPLLAMSGVTDTNGNPLAKEMATALKKYYDAPSPQFWQSYNVSRSRAMKLINSKLEIISALASDS